MAIEKQFPEEIIDTTTTQDADALDSEIIDVLDAMGEGEENMGWVCRGE